MLERETFTDQDVGDYFNAHFVCLKIDVDSKDGKIFADKFNIHSIPTLMYFDGLGSVIHRSEGYLDPTRLLSSAKDIVNPEMSETAIMKREYFKGKKDKDFLFAYFSKLQENEMDCQSVGTEYLKAIAPSQILADSGFLVFFLTRESISSPFTAYFKEHLNDFYYKFGSELVKRKIDSLITNEMSELKKFNSTSLRIEQSKEYQNLLLFIQATMPKNVAETEIESLKGELADKN